ncbi:hypothetical protein Pcac1_g9129 [Phytophthora cactorum]|nr:hypothetical protein Pcac1_g9129 [Phytophthora cactorum]
MLIDDGHSLGFFAGKLSTDEYTRVDVQNAQESYRVVTDIITEHAAARPTNTNTQYASKQAAFMEWCASKNYSDGCIVTKGKLVTFLKSTLSPVGTSARILILVKTKALSMAGVEAYAKTVIDLYKLQQTLQLNQHAHPRGITYHDFLDTVKRSETERKRKNYVDRALGTVLDSYNMEDMCQLTKQWLS